VSPVPDLLIRITSQLSSVVEESGFTLVDPVDADDTTTHGEAHQAAIQMVCYRKMQPGVPTTLLELWNLTEECWITATLWRPNDLIARERMISVDEVALHHQSWSYDHATNLGPLAGEIVEEIACWLGQIGRVASPPAATDDERR
jgi:hypothetical protein